MDGWEGIEEFVAVARTGSFIAGAASLGVSRTHMSRALARLEDRLGAQLLHRTTRRVLLSPTGQTFLDHCIRLVQERDEAVALIRDQGEPRGDLRITCCVALGERFIAPVARQFAKQHRQLTVYLDVTDRTIDLVAEGYDLGVRTGNLPSSDLIAAKIASRRSRTCAAPAYLERMGTPEKIADLNEHDCLTGTTLQWHFSEKGDEILYRPRPVWSCNNGYAVLEAARDGMGICQLPNFYLNDAVQSGQLVPILEEFAPPEEPIWSVYPDKRHLSPKVQRFVAALKGTLPKAMARPD
ncbi:LysR family transcriptional regulator [Sphingobium sp. LMC3-1-1.1]|uniref:LysR family transcriptional regulator n=1 Tax=Sphingobium sp. LMC3-1-1.1 TaxID=3135241 RepID=UPI00342C9D1F